MWGSVKVAYSGQLHTHGKTRCPETADMKFLFFLCSVVVKRKSIKLKGRTPVTQTSTKATAAANDKEMVRYTCESLQISPNAAYEGVTFSDEPIYDQPM